MSYILQCSSTKDNTKCLRMEEITMKTQKLFSTNKLGLKILERAALISAHAGANSTCSYIYHDPKKPEALKKLKKI